MPKLTDTQFIILSAAAQRDDRGVELPANLKGGAARKVVGKLIRAGLLEEVRVRGSLREWRRDDDNGPLALRITKQGLEAVGVEDPAAREAEDSELRHGEAPQRQCVARHCRYRGQVDDPRTSRRIFPPRCACATASLMDESG
jgi:hypothetical protein